jgi:hypothetical protein
VVSGAAYSDSLRGECGGTARISGTKNATNGYFNALGTLLFSGYCSSGADGTQVVLDGSVDFTMSGTDSRNFVFTMDSPYLSATVGGQAYLYAINYSCTFTGGVAGTVTLTANYQAPDGKVYRVQDYRVSVDTSTQRISIQGLFYHPDFGYVMVTTPSDYITYQYCSNVLADLPASGTMRVTGAGGHYGEFAAGDCWNYRIYYYDGVSTTFTDYSW